MRVCILSYRSYPFSGGQGVYMRYLSSALRDLGHEVDLISGPPYPEVDEGVGLVKLPSLDLYSPFSYRRLLLMNPTRLNNLPNFIEWAGTILGNYTEPLVFGMRAYRYLCGDGRKKYDVVHDNQTMAYGILDIMKAGYPVVETIHHPVTIDRDMAVQSARTIKGKIDYYRWFSFVNMQIKVARQLPHIITVSQVASRHISEVFKIPQSRLNVIYNGIDTDIFSPSDDVKRADNMILMVMSRDTLVKGLRFLLEALAAIKEKYDMKLVVVGQTMKGSDSEELIGRLSLADRVSFRERIDTAELVNLYRQATIMAVPSTYEGFGLPAAEAMACGAPVISTTAGALPEVVGDAGVLIAPADSKVLAGAIAELMDNPERRRQYGILGRRRILEQFNWANAARKTAEVYVQAVEHAHLKAA
ncbi:MAG: glycosyltransferase family 4 protein [Dehalococcoidia bacterium]|nr:glycosyltransferase family 4 protein [Dehalococcoidia bacterium]MDD5493156.1 glycosyltransferase family 4 protein [Dehalococcoidia bacterium]